MAVEGLRAQAAPAAEITHPRLLEMLAAFDAAMSDDLNTALAFTAFDLVVALKKIDKGQQLAAIMRMDGVFGLDLPGLTRADLRIRPKAAVISEEAIEAALVARKAARAEKNFARSDALRDELAAQGVEVMDGDPLGWEWKLGA